MKTIGIIIIVLVLVGGGYVLARTVGPAEKTENTSAQMPQSGHMGHDDHAALVTDEKSFIEEMIPHHEEAITSSQELLTVAKTPEVRSLAENIITAQEKEVADMKGWYRDWFGKEYQPTGNYKPMMQSLKGKSVEAAEQTYLMDMMMHHRAAIEMAEVVLPIAEHEEVKTLGNAIIRTQNDEITQIQKLVHDEMPHNMH